MRPLFLGLGLFPLRSGAETEEAAMGCGDSLGSIGGDKVAMVIEMWRFLLYGGWRESVRWLFCRRRKRALVQEEDQLDRCGYEGVAEGPTFT